MRGNAMAWAGQGRVRPVRRPPLHTSADRSSDESRRRGAGLARVRLVTVAAAALLVPLAGCSVGDAPEEPDAKTVELRVSPAKFDRTNQVIGDAVTLSMTVTNTGDTKAPNLVVTLRGLEESESPLQGNEGTELTRDGERSAKLERLSIALRASLRSFARRVLSCAGID